MNTYVTQLLDDLEDAILARWQKCLPHFYAAGLNEHFLEPPKGFKLQSDRAEDDDLDMSISDLNLTALTDDDTDLLSPSSDDVMSNLEIDKSITEMEQWRDEPPPAKQDMYYHFGFMPEQFPPMDRLTDAELEALTIALCRLWAAYNFTPVFPENTPSRALYPLLIKHMYKPTFVMMHGNLGVEFCDYDPKQCPFGEEWCGCKASS